MKFTLLTPEKRIVINQEVEEVLVPGHSGQLDILPGHAPLMTLLSTGILRWRLKGSAEQNKIVVSWGYCEVNPEGVIVLAESSVLPEEVETESFKSEIKSLESKLGIEFLEKEQWDEAQRRLAELKSSLEMGTQK
jgi:F-type H+-transporting ATPase subunit epsilon